jgi:hypothetical protein
MTTTPSCLGTPVPGTNTRNRYKVRAATCDTCGKVVPRAIGGGLVTHFA